MKIKCDEKISTADVYVLGICNDEKSIKTKLENKYKKIIENTLLNGVKGSFGEFYLINNLDENI